MPSIYKFTSDELKNGLNALLKTEMETTDSDFEEVNLLTHLDTEQIEEYKGILSMLKKETLPKVKDIGKVIACFGFPKH